MALVMITTEPVWVGGGPFNQTVEPLVTKNSGVELAAEDGLAVRLGGLMLEVLRLSLVIVGPAVRLWPAITVTTSVSVIVNW